jgi:sugar lactone lactonase YvrE
VWVALFGGGEVRRYRADGTVDRRVRLPMTPVTSVAFGGDDLGDLYVTTGRYKLSDEALAEQPLAGALLRFRPGVRGRPQHVFGG